MFYIINRSHEDNHKEIECRGRRLGSCEELRNVIGERAEQLNNRLKKYEHSVNLMNPANFFHSVRQFVLRHNNSMIRRIKDDFEKRMQKCSLDSAQFVYPFSKSAPLLSDVLTSDLIQDQRVVDEVALTPTPPAVDIGVSQISSVVRDVVNPTNVTDQALQPSSSSTASETSQPLATGAPETANRGKTNKPVKTKS